MRPIHIIIITISVLAIAVGGWQIYIHQTSGSPSITPTATSTPTPTPTPVSMDDLIKVTAPLPNASVSSPLTISGQARGTWYFEASFPVKIYDANGKLLGSTPAQATSDWMTENYVPFQATLTFSAPTTATGTLVLENDNPSGLPQNAKQISIPVRFATPTTTSAVPQRTVKLYYYDPAQDPDNDCGSAGSVAVERLVPITSTPIQDTIRLLLEAKLTSQERSQGITTEFPLPGLALKSASLSKGVLTLTFADPQFKTSGGSCRVGILWSQIEATAKQFPGVLKVKALPADVFQP